MSMTTTLPHLVLGTEIDPDDPTKTHIVDCPDDKPNAEAWVTEARIFGLELTALCVHKWYAMLAPEKHPLCQPCVDEAKRRLGEGA